MNGGDWGSWVMQGVLGSVGFNWQLGSLATNQGQGGVGREGEAGKAEAGRRDLFFFTPANQRKIDRSDPVIISLALSSTARFRSFITLKGTLPLHCFFPQFSRPVSPVMCFPIHISQIPSRRNALFSDSLLLLPSWGFHVRLTSSKPAPVNPILFNLLSLFK